MMADAAGGGKVIDGTSPDHDSIGGVAFNLPVAQETAIRLIAVSRYVPSRPISITPCVTRWGGIYLHRSRLPLAEVDLGGRDVAGGVARSECGGICGL